MKCNFCGDEFSEIDYVHVCSKGKFAPKFAPAPKPIIKEKENMMTFSRFDFEQEIMGCWNLVDELKVLTEGVLEHEMTRDQISNVLIGLSELYQLKFDKLFDSFERGIYERKIQ